MPRVATGGRYDRPGRRLSIISHFPAAPAARSGRPRSTARPVHPHLLRLKSEREFILVGDINIAHKEIDLRTGAATRRTAASPEERASMTRLLEQDGLVDVFRTLNPRPDNTP